MKRIIIFILLIFTFLGLFAQNSNILLIEAHQERIKIERKYFEIYEDTTNSLTFDEVHSDDFKMFYSFSSRKELKMNTNYWLKIQKWNDITDDNYNYWVLGKVPELEKPRWCIVRDVLHWIE